MPQNKLAAAVSPYLLQHKDNPVHWRMWGEAALAEARRLNKPILLSIGYAACHWCHVMAHESFEDAGVAAVMNELTRSTWRRFTPSMVAETASPAWRPLSRTAHWAGPIAMGADRSLACRPTEFRSWPKLAIRVLQSYVRFREPPHWRGTAVMGADRSFACQVNAFRTSFSRLVSSQSVNHRDKRSNRPNLPIRFTARSEDGGIAQSRYYACNDRTGDAEWEEQMATGQKRSTREKKKPKANKKVVVPA